MSMCKHAQRSLYRCSKNWDTNDEWVMHPWKRRQKDACRVPSCSTRHCMQTARNPHQARVLHASPSHHARDSWAQMTKREFCPGWKCSVHTEMQQRKMLSSFPVCMHIVPFFGHAIDTFLCKNNSHQGALTRSDFDMRGGIPLKDGCQRQKKMFGALDGLHVHVIRHAGKNCSTPKLPHNLAPFST